MFNLDVTPYSLNEDALNEVGRRLKVIEERIALLRRNGTLTEQTVRDYYGEKRFEQVAESNAIEGSTLSAGETELAVLKGITITGHDPAFVKDAISLDKALTRITEIARDKKTPTDISNLHEIHALLLGERHGAGIFRRERVTIRGAKHIPPKTWEQIMEMMTSWESWSKENATLPAPIRAAIMQAWLTHIHPYIDGNGRISRAMGNLELIKAGYPPIVIKKKERDRYLEALADSDEGGDIRAFLELIFDRIEGAIVGLELSAKRKQGFDPAIEKIRQMQERQLHIWETSIKLLASIIEHRVSQSLESVGGTFSVKSYESPLDIDDYQEVCAGHGVTHSWAFSVHLEIPGISRLANLAYIAPRSLRMRQYLDMQGGPSLYWSIKNTTSFPKWLSAGTNSPYAEEITSRAGNGDEWIVRLTDHSFHQIQTTELAEKIAKALIEQVQV